MASVPGLLPGSGRTVPGAPTPQGDRAHGGSAHSPCPALREGTPPKNPLFTGQPPRPVLFLRIRGAQGSTHPGWRGTRAARALHLPEHLSAALASASGAAPAQTEGPRVVAKASYLRPIPVLNPVLCLVPRSPPSSRSRLLKKPGAAEFRLPALQPQRRGRRVRKTRGCGGGGGRRAGDWACSVRGRRRRASRRCTCRPCPREKGLGAREQSCDRVPSLNPGRPMNHQADARAGVKRICCLAKGNKPTRCRLLLQPEYGGSRRRDLPGYPNLWPPGDAGSR